MDAGKQPEHDATEGAAERTAQKELTARIGTRLVRRTKTAESKRTPRWRFPTRKGTQGS
jgi:hypothetical protein